MAIPILAVPNITLLMVGEQNLHDDEDISFCCGIRRKTYIHYTLITNTRCYRNATDKDAI